MVAPTSNRLGDCHTKTDLIVNFPRGTVDPQAETPALSRTAAAQAQQHTMDDDKTPTSSHFSEEKIRDQARIRLGMNE